MRAVHVFEIWRNLPNHPVLAGPIDIGPDSLMRRQLIQLIICFLFA